MRKLLLVILAVSIFSGSLFATTFVGLGFTRELSGQQRNFIDGRLTFGNMLTIDVEGSLCLSNLNPMYSTQIYTYVNFSIPISNFEIYAGFSPTFFFAYGNFSTYEFQQHGYLHAGIAAKFQKIRIYGELFKILYYSPIQLGDVTLIEVGGQFGF
ncbi:hypothetical protein [Mesoaciditoga lauensis]|uniref:hypothetical protein n=1 Tax=Mesoaciditoga lauensis TaxID=1495039 RepID=UPI00055FE7F7|nr:hypothetical protein [Mesoaciditoga lauensis]